MKNIIMLSMFFFVLTSCSKDSLDPSTDSYDKPVKSEIMVRITYLTWMDAGENGCGNSGGQVVTTLANAMVELYDGNQSDSDALGTPILNTRTDHSGSALLRDIDPSTYTVSVDTPLGTKSRTITTTLHKRSFIDFSF